MSASHAFFIAALAVGSACATVDVHTEHDGHADLRRYRTFALAGGEIVVEGASEDRAWMARNLLDGSLRAGLVARGLAPVPDGADLLVRYQATARAEPRLRNVGSAYVMGSSLWHGPAGSDYCRTYSGHDTLVVELVDAASKAVVWRVRAAAVDVPLLDPAFIDAAVAKSLEGLPGR
jgi:hypothetical protein